MSIVNTSKLIIFQKKMNCSLLAVQSVFQTNTVRVNTVQCGCFDQELAAVTLSLFHIYRAKEKCQAKLRSGREYRLKAPYQVFLDDMEHCWIWENHRNIDKRKNTLLFARENFIKIYLFQFPRQMVITKCKVRVGPFYMRTSGEVTCICR